MNADLGGGNWGQVHSALCRSAEGANYVYTDSVPDQV